MTPNRPAQEPAPPIRDAIDTALDMIEQRRVAWEAEKAERRRVRNEKRRARRKAAKERT